MSKKNIQKLLQQMAGKKKKKVKKPDPRAEALRGRKYFSKGSGESSMVKEAQRNYNGSYVSGDLGGVKVGNKSYAKYYSNPGFKMGKI
jgi:hypothetical protein|tara:strand:- start:233 stop:496 length:264 start_codon:yes stop_codon:yes gene_type:complete